MASYQKTREALLEAYPALYLDEGGVLHHLFFVLGNGYDWKRGELTDYSGTPLKEYVRAAYTAARARYEQEIAYATDSLMRAFWREKLKHIDAPSYVATERARETARRLRFIGEGDDSWFLLPDGTIGEKLYPLCALSKILHVPPDVKPSWLAAAHAAIEWANGPRCRATKSDRAWLRKAALRLKKLKRVK